jgi:hypothetical protein
LRYEKELQKQHYEKQLEELRTKVDSCWTQQDADKKDLQEQLVKVQTEQEFNRLRYAQEKARQEEKYNTMQKQMADFQELFKSPPIRYFC